MVDSKQRRCGYKLYKIVNGLPASAPDCKIALIKKQYSLKPDVDTKIADPSAAWSSVGGSALQQLERMLRYLKQDDVRSELTASLKEKDDQEAIGRELRLKLAELNLVVVGRFETAALKNQEMPVSYIYNRHWPTPPVPSSPNTRLQCRRLLLGTSG